MNKVYHCDAIKGLRKLYADHGSCIDMVLTSPPYDELRDYSYDKWSFDVFKDIAYEIFRVMKDGGTIVWVCADQTIAGNRSGNSFRQALYFKQLGMNLYDVMIWHKTKCPYTHPHRYTNAFEYMFVISKGKPKTANIIKDKRNIHSGANKSHFLERGKDGKIIKRGDNYKVNEYGARHNIWRYSGASANEDKRDHPAVMNPQIARDHIISWSNPGDLVLDPFMGSGTTMEEAFKLGRQYVGFEINIRYINIIKEVQEKMQGGLGLNDK